MRELLGTGQKEVGSRQRVGVASGDTPSVHAQRVPLRWARACCVMWQFCSHINVIVRDTPHRPEPNRCVVGKISFHNVTRRCKSGFRADKSSSGHCGRATPRSGSDLADLPRTTFRDAICSGEHGEVIRARCGLSGQPGSRTESSPSTGQFFGRGSWGRQCKGQQRWMVTTLASPTVASVSIVRALECDLVATQWDPIANASAPMKDLESLSGTVEFSSRDEGLVWPNVGRDVAVKTVESVHQVPSAVDGERCLAVFPMAQGEMFPSPRRSPPSRRLVLAPGTGTRQSVHDRCRLQTLWPASQ